MEKNIEQVITMLRGSGDFSVEEMAQAWLRELAQPLSLQLAASGAGVTQTRLATAQAYLCVLRGQPWDAAATQYRRTLRAHGFSRDELEIAARDCRDALRAALQAGLPARS